MCLYRRGVGTELGSKAANKLDSIQGILKDPPKKVGLKRRSVDEEDIYGGGLHGTISGTNAVPYNLLTVRATEGGGEGGGKEHRGAFQPGPYTDRSLRNSVNAIPLKESRESTSPTFHPQPFR